MRKKILILRYCGTSILLFFCSIFAVFGDFVPLAINPEENAGNVHYNSGGRRIVRINNTILALCPSGSLDWTYRSKNNGSTWECIDKNGSFSGCLISGRDSMAYHFYRSGNSIYMTKFHYNSIPAKPIAIYTEERLKGEHGVYDMLTATVDSAGTLFISSHWNPDSNGRQASLYLISSDDAGASWTKSGEALIINRGSPEHSWGYVHMDVNVMNEIVCTYSEYGSKSVQFSKSADNGKNWKTVEIARAVGENEIYNPAILPVGKNEIYIFAQSNFKTPHGLVVTKSIDAGNTWNEWSEIDGTSFSGYADPSPALSASGDIYVAYRSGARPDLKGVSGGAGCRERLARSSDGGKTWDFPDNYFYTASGDTTGATGTRSQIRYQTWWNYGGPLEWIWMQMNNGKYNTFYDLNTLVNISQLNMKVGIKKKLISDYSNSINYSGKTFISNYFNLLGQYCGSKNGYNLANGLHIKDATDRSVDFYKCLYFKGK
jgi:hypothetical protein